MRLTPPLRKRSPLRLASNILAGLALLVGVMLLIDWSSIQLGSAPFILCTVIPVLGAVAPPAGILATIVGVLYALLSRSERMFGVFLAVAGVLLWQTPDLVGLVIAPRC